MQVGDLVKHKKNGIFGIVWKIAIDPYKTNIDDLYLIQWTNGAKGSHWSIELETISENQ